MCSIGNFGLVPIDVLKIRAQNTMGSHYSYREEVPKILKQEGYRCLFKGFWATACRDVPGWAVYFYVYEGLKSMIFRSKFF